LDKYEEDLENKIKELKACQNKNKIKSCQQCDIYIDCWLRKKYVSTVYSSMSKGNTGGFEF